jgi:nuclear transport factor 2 (NTF2) superfamily protein
MSSGDVTETVDMWRERLGFTVDRERATSYLAEVWEREELESLSDEVLARRVLWMACGELHAQGEWNGVIV